MVFTPLPKRLTPVPFFGYDGRHVRGGTGGGGAEVLSVVVRRKDASAIGTNSSSAYPAATDRYCQLLF
jgi:hypothetical protein